MADAPKLPPSFAKFLLARVRSTGATGALTLALTSAVFLRVGPPSRAQAADAVPAAKTSSSGRLPLPVELKRLDYFRGTWICTGVVEPTGTAPAHLTKGKATFKWDNSTGGFFQLVTSQNDRTKEDPIPRVARGYLGYEEQTKEYTLALFYIGGGRLVAAAPSFTDEGLKFVGDSTQRGGHMRVEQVITRKTDTEYLSEVDGLGADGKVTKLFHEKCVKNGK
jgi:hypothetical protein